MLIVLEFNAIGFSEYSPPKLPVGLRLSLGLSVVESSTFVQLIAEIKRLRASVSCYTDL